MNEEKPQHLKRELGALTGVFVVMNMVIGSEVFFKMSEIVAIVSSSGLALLSLLVAGIISLIGGLTVAELAASIPKTGGMTIWLEEAYGEGVSFLSGWTLIVLAQPSFVASLVAAFGTQFVRLFDLESQWAMPIGLALMAFLTLVNCLGTRYSGIITNLATVAKLIPIALIIVGGLWKGQETYQAVLSLDSSGPVGSFTTFGAALLAYMYIYDGWLQVGAISRDMKNPKRDLPRAIVFGLLGIISIFLLVLTAYLKVIPAEELAQSTAPAMDVAALLVGPFGAKCVAVSVLVSLFGTMSQNIFVGSRLSYAMAKQNQLPAGQYLKALHPKTANPVNAYLLNAALTCLFCLSGGYKVLTDIATFSVWLFFTLTFVACFILRRKYPALERPVQVPLYPVLPVVAILSGLYILGSYIFNQSHIAIPAIGLIALGIPLYFWRKDLFIPLEAAELE